jgi:hypothetical protein
MLVDEVQWRGEDGGQDEKRKIKAYMLLEERLENTELNLVDESISQS